jgi:hypothetical protein
MSLRGRMAWCQPRRWLEKVGSIPTVSTKIEECMFEEITLVVTSCGRYDLLAQTLESFYKFNTYPIKEVIVTEDWNQESQVKSLDRAYARVKTPYIFACEDDWQFYKSGFIEESLEILEKYPKILQVWLREHNDTNGHPIVKLPQFDCETMKINWGFWSGFSWNPGLRRLSDYQAIGSSYSKFGQEHLVSKAYADMGYHAAITPFGYVRHIGWTRGLPKV